MSLLVICGIAVSWEPGPQVIGHSHPHDGSHLALPHHSPSGLASADSGSGLPLSQDSAPVPSDFHYHIFPDSHLESCTERNPASITLREPSPGFSRGTNDLAPDPPMTDIDHPPLI